MLRSTLRRRLVPALVAGLAAVLIDLAAPTAWAVAPTPVNLNSSSCPTKIQQGESDGCVTELQKLLDQHGQSITVDGSFGPSTYGAVRIFQSQSGIAVDGIVGPRTKQSLYNNSAGGLPGPVNLNSPDCPATVQQGQSGGCVTELQNLLNQHGATLVLDGSFGPATLTAVKSFQSGAGLSADGLVGPATKNALYNGTSSIPAVDLRSPSCPATLQSGEIDGCVTTLQTLLSAHGQHLAVDGDFGPATLTAVKSFQSGAGLSADGLVGPATKAALYRDVGSGTSAPGPINLTSPSCPANMQQGERDGCVTELQNLLNQHGASLTLDGIFGPATASAVESFQSDALLPVDGIAGPHTKAALYNGTIVLVGCEIPDGMTECATGDGMAARAVNLAHYYYDAPKSASQAADQVRLKQRYGFGTVGAIPYVWGGGHGGSPGPSYGTCQGYTGAIQPCPAASTKGLDCSGFVRLIYKMAAAIDIAPGGGGTNQEIKNAHLHAVPRSDLRPGDLIFWGAGTDNTDHVAMYLGSEYVVTTDNSASPLNPYSPPLTGTGPAVIEAWFTGSHVGIHLLSQHSRPPVGYYHVKG
ncbi:peptidoglycan-binding protein [Streptomyces sp. NPDC051677]|uniref:C40 family peptidase n=1 Tax=Streptomyces sp. NPDC051677 TaxID=3365669 RepID=UPI0037CF8ECE